MEIFPGVSMDPGVRFGKPCIAGTRVDVATVVAGLAANESFEAVQEKYQLTRDQVIAGEMAAHLDTYGKPDPESRVFVGADGGALRANGWRARHWRPATHNPPAPAVTSVTWHSHGIAAHA